MRDTRRDLAHRSQLFRHHQLLCRPLQPPVRLRQSVGALLYLLIQVRRPVAQLPVAFLHLIQQIVEVMGNPPDLILGPAHLDPRAQIARLH